MNLKKALEEQAAAANVVSTVDRVAHFKYLKNKFGPKTKPKNTVFVYKTDGREKYFLTRDSADEFLRRLAEEAKSLDPFLRLRDVTDIMKDFARNLTEHEVEV